MDEELGESRPKIHKLPDQTVKAGRLYVTRAMIIMCMALFVVTAIPAIWSLRNSNTAEESSTPPSIQISDRRNPVEMESVTIYDNQGNMVGQMVKMPHDVEKGATVSTTAKVDKKSGRELLSIISQY